METPALELTHTRVACSKHLEPFRTNWPSTGYTSWAVDLLESYDPGSETDPNVIAFLLDEHPLCERVTRAALLGAYLRSGIGVQRRCLICMKSGLGTAITARQATGAPQKLRHVCFECLLDRMHRVN